MTIEGSDKPSNISDLHTLNTDRYYSLNPKLEQHALLKNEIKRLSHKLELIERIK